ncbi:MAG: carboxymuconolactone decarboxylase family protein [Phycisphaerales bacterium JB059]
MPRLTPIDPETATGRAREIFDGPLKGKHFNIFKGLANSPAALDMYLAMNAALSKASLSAKEQEVIQLAIGRANDCDYCQAAHTAIGQGAGLTEAQTLGARRGEIEDDAKLSALAKFALTLHEKKGFVSDADLSAFREAGYDDAAITEVVASYALATFTNMFNHVNDSELDFPPAPPL